MTMTGAGMCTDTTISCQNLTLCENDNKACSTPNTVCVNNTRCNVPVCYPIERASSQRCPSLNSENVTTTTSHDSLIAKPGSGTGQYISNEGYVNAVDNGILTKYNSLGARMALSYNDYGGLNTGFYLTFTQLQTRLVGFSIGTANDAPERDPMAITIEGLTNDPRRNTYGPFQSIPNQAKYTSYRFLVTTKRSASESTQYSEVQFFS
ncbi:unnamed protein product [Adineta steineri]|nr:unnamed protein product [Adineta steineri]CAF0895174.1 unnamed protein product [Adineta steineri]